jgi:FkbM family methyltransferase
MYTSQVGQDAWVHSVVGDKRNGYFIELGASDGLYLSNTYFFEKTLNWNGICIEPNPTFHTKLQENRNCHIAHNCVSSENDKEVEFSLCGHASGTLATAGPFTLSNETIRIKTKTLDSILAQFNAPQRIDYLSLDVEGHELEILKNFPFDKYQFNCITVEHNEPHTGPAMQQDLRTLLTTNGYHFIKGNDDVHKWNHGPIDDFYIHSSLIGIKH